MDKNNPSYTETIVSELKIIRDLLIAVVVIGLGTLAWFVIQLIKVVAEARKLKEERVAKANSQREEERRAAIEQARTRAAAAVEDEDGDFEEEDEEEMEEENADFLA